jgi:predicted secreted protein
MAGVPLSAKNCKVRINNAVLFNSKWTATPETALLDTSNMEGGGFEDQIGGLRKLQIEIEGWWDSAANMFDAPLSLQDGQNVTFICYTNDIGSPNWSGTAIVARAPMTADVHDLVKYALSLKAKGSFNLPT